jgi:hypothetical protein
MTQVQVWEGTDDPYYRLQAMLEHAVCQVMELCRDLQETAKWFPTGPAAIRSRLVFMDRLIDWIRGKTSWSSAVTAYRDLQEINSLLVAVNHHETMVRNVEKVLSDINELRGIRG